MSNFDKVNLYDMKSTLVETMYESTLIYCQQIFLVVLVGHCLGRLDNMNAFATYRCSDSYLWKTVVKLARALNIFHW